MYGAYIYGQQVYGYSRLERIAELELSSSVSVLDTISLHLIKPAEFASTIFFSAELCASALRHFESISSISTYPHLSTARIVSIDLSSSVSFGALCSIYPSLVADLCGEILTMSELNLYRAGYAEFTSQVQVQAGLIFEHAVGLHLATAILTQSELSPILYVVFDGTSIVVLTSRLSTAHRQVCIYEVIGQLAYTTKLDESGQLVYITRLNGSVPLRW